MNFPFNNGGLGNGKCQGHSEEMLESGRGIESS